MPGKILKDELVETFQVDEATKKGLLILYKVLALPCIVAAFIIFLDLFLPLHTTDRGVIMGKKRQKTENTSLLVEVQGKRFHYWERVNKKAFPTLEKGDRVVLTLSPILKRVRKIEVVEAGKTTVIRGKDFFPMLVLALLGLSTLLPYLVGTRIFSRPFFVVVVATPLLALVSTVFILKLVLISLGLMNRM